ncbi:four-helix bundle copper-binding protein [Streptomyces kaempferi]|uniref:Four-helix bundle copper-binding protein n=1 Tax=Streptomyces kaempferi TaxID=333725 RepID=A0ABW3XUW0_9ACTN
MMHSEQMSSDMKKCVDACLAAYSMCEETINHCLQQGSEYLDPAMMRTLMDCADMTRMCADMCMRMSPMSKDMCTLCAQVCDMATEACMRMENDPQMQRCADACRACAESCRSMAGIRA